MGKILVVGSLNVDMVMNVVICRLKEKRFYVMA